jgi:hypothetical protein
MKSIKLHIKHLSNPDLIIRDMNNYTNGFMLLYKMLDVSSDREFMERFKKRFNLTDIVYRSLVADVKSARNQDIANNNERIERIEELTEKLKETEADKRYKLYKKITELKRRLGKERTFGTLSKLRGITKECNKSEPDIERLNKLKDEYHKARIKPIYVIGEANYSGNRFFGLYDLHLGKCTYKPRKGESCEITFKVTNKKDLERVAKYSKLKEVSVTVQLTTEYIAITFDEQQLNGYGIDEKERRKEVKEVKDVGYTKETQTNKIKEIYRKYYDEQREHMMKDKMENRCMAVDLNPTNIGWCILDKTNDGNCKIVACGQYEYEWLCRKLGKASSSPEQKHLNNKRKHEICMMARNLFRMATHYKCGQFIMEDLSFKKDEVMNREANRKNKNLWCRELITNLINRWCNELGIILTEINACYSSFIGNIQNGFVDATNASIEIGRRGVWRHTNGTFYPAVRQEDLSTVEAKFGVDADSINTDGWGVMYNALKNLFKPDEFSYRLRTAIDGVGYPYRSFSMSSCKSGVNSIIFNKLH